MTKNDFKQFLSTSKNAYFDANAFCEAFKLIDKLSDESLLKELSTILIFKKSYGLKDFSDELENLLLKKAREKAINSKIKFKNESEKQEQNMSEFELLTLYFYKKLKGE